MVPQALEIIGKLFEIEKSLKGKEESNVLAARRAQTLPLVDNFFK